MYVEGAGALEGRERIGRGVGTGGDGEEEGEWYVGIGRRGGRG